MSPGSKLSGACVLVVDDDAAAVSSLSRLLRTHGYEVLTAARGNEAIDIARREAPDVVLSDWMMPGLSGPELCAALRADVAVPWCYVILLTGLGGAQLVNGLDSGADGYLSKPCANDALLAHVRAGVRVVRLHRELDCVNRRIRDEVAQARAIQQRLLPQRLPCIDGFELASRYRPTSECGGDYFDVLVLPDGRLLAVIADVCGHGTPAMITTTLFRLLVRTLGSVAGSPASLMAQLDSMLAEHRCSEHFLTCALAFVDPSSGRVDYASAGHPPILHLARDGTAMPLIAAIGPPLMSGFDAGYVEGVAFLLAGDSLVLYTDGAIEAPTRDGSEFGIGRLACAFATHGTAASRVGTFATRFTDAVGEEAPDDVTVLVLRRQGAEIPSA